MLNSQNLFQHCLSVIFIWIFWQKLKFFYLKNLFKSKPFSIYYPTTFLKAKSNLQNLLFHDPLTPDNLHRKISQQMFLGEKDYIEALSAVTRPVWKTKTSCWHATPGIHRSRGLTYAPLFNQLRNRTFASYSKSTTTAGSDPPDGQGAEEGFRVLCGGRLPCHMDCQQNATNWQKTFFERPAKLKPPSKYEDSSKRGKKVTNCRKLRILAEPKNNTEIENKQKSKKKGQQICKRLGFYAMQQKINKNGGEKKSIYSFR